MATTISRCIGRILSRQTAPTGIVSADNGGVLSSCITAVKTLKTSAPLSAEPKKKKKVDPRREQMVRERMKKKLKKLERVPPEFIPIEDFITPTKCLDETRVRAAPRLSFDESESRALLLKEWCRYKNEQHLAEMQAIELALEAQKEALEELKAESEELYQAALKPDPLLFPFSHEGPSYTPPKIKYEAPDGKYNDVTKVYTQ
ncbi:39S ribosomal protein L40, mitochondrial [Corythoichthys intestinalis]|uniref:39S ribosomal protein L40, mitochondrial n=1 Tax=Corythoichthys intestinalis TaxID=161448 RepID=UPI0025A51FAA|nr:39S ribosomal protein L40, mitochondrial [Corythoichthys intestinalis]XP_061804761.1 large ribosomal subunit protein mL40-like [Nerophis lumbriciformis]